MHSTTKTLAALLLAVALAVALGRFGFTALNITW
jgi:hypothetical protein